MSSPTASQPTSTPTSQREHENTRTRFHGKSAQCVVKCTSRRFVINNMMNASRACRKLLLRLPIAPRSIRGGGGRAIRMRPTFALRQLQQQSESINSNSILPLQRSRALSTTSSSSSINATPKILSTAVIRSIKSDLLEADADKDGQLDFDDLKSILSKYTDTFTNDEVERIGDIFYVGSGGSSISHQCFLRAVQHSASGGAAESSPLRLQSVKDNRCFLSPQHDAAYYDTAGEFDQHLKRYIRRIMERNGAV